MTATTDAVMTALAGVMDPEINRPLTELGMVKSVDIVGTVARVGIWLTVSGCPMRETITSRVTEAVALVDGVSAVEVELDVMDDERRKTLKETLRGPSKTNPFAEPGSRTRVIAIASGKGGVGKSSICANLAILLAQKGLSVGLLDADVYGHSIPNILGCTDAPHRVEGMIMPPQAHGIRVISMLAFKPGGISQPIAMRGPMLHRLVEQFLTDVWWGDLDLLLLDLPPGTGDIAMSVGSLLPSSELIVVTTPQPAAAEVAVRAGTMATHTKQRIAGVIENMAAFPCPCCGEPIDVFGSGGGALVTESLSRELGAPVPLLGRVPFDVRLREGGDAGEPLVLSDPGAPASTVLAGIADQLAVRPSSLVGKPLGLTPARA